jgi:hypothetical protein
MKKYFEFNRSNDVVPNLLYIMAEWVSHVFNPAVIACAILLWRAWIVSVPYPVLILLLCFYVFIPAGSVLFMLYTNRINSIYPKQRKQREKLLVVGLFSYSVGWLIANKMGIDPFLLSLSLVFVLSTLFVLCINRYWMISIHCVGVAAAVTLVVSVSEDGILFGTLPVVLITWARLYLRAHTLSQVLAGLILGTIVGGGAFLKVTENIDDAIL